MAGAPKPRIRQMADIAPLRVKGEAYQAASWVHPDLRNWAPSLGSADSDIIPELGTLVRRSRDLERNHGVAGGARQTILDNVLGCGLWLAPTPDYAALGKDRQWASKWRTAVKAKWRSWAETTSCDAGETLTLDGLARLIFNGAWVNGEGLALPLWLPQSGHPAATRLQVIEADRLSNPLGALDSVKLRGGIEIDAYCAPQAYWIRNAHPGEQFWYADMATFTWTRVPAKTSWGRRRVIHAHDKTRAGQSRGVPALAGVLHQFKVLGDYQRAELKSAVVNAMVAMVTESSVGQEGVLEMLSGDKDAIANYVKAYNERERTSLNFREGLIVPLMFGEKVGSFSPARPSTAYEPFVSTVFRHIATGLNIPYELLMKDFSQSNYSSARAALLEAWRFFTGKRDWLGQMFYQPAYELWMEEMFNAGEIEAPGFYENRAAYCRARWIGPGRGWVDPLKEAQAAELRMGIRVSTLEDECAEQGKDWEEVLEQIAEEEARMKELGVERRVPARLEPKGATDPNAEQGGESVPGKGGPNAPAAKAEAQRHEIHVHAPITIAEGAIQTRLKTDVHAHVHRGGRVTFEEDADGSLVSAELEE